MAGKTKRNGERSGITLIELMIAIVLAGMIAVMLTRPFEDGRAALQATSQREQALSIAERMIESYRAMGYSGMSQVGVVPTVTSTISHGNVTIGPITYTRTMRFISLPGTPLVAAPENPGDGWFCTDTVTQGGVTLYTTRFRAIECTVSWTGAGGAKSVSLVGVIAP